MPRFIVRYQDANSGPRVTTVEAGDADAALAQQRKFSSEGTDFTAELINPREPPKEAAAYKDQRWPMTRKGE